MRPGELLSFRVLIPIVIHGVTAIERDALVTARVTLSKRGGIGVSQGDSYWAMEDVVAADNTRILFDPRPARETMGYGAWKTKARIAKVVTRSWIRAGLREPAIRRK